MLIFTITQLIKTHNAFPTAKYQQRNFHFVHTVNLSISPAKLRVNSMLRKANQSINSVSD